MAYRNQIFRQSEDQVGQPLKLADPVHQVIRLFARLSISHKLNVGFGVLVLLTFLVVGRNAWGGLFASRNIKQTQQVRVPAALASNQAQQELLKMSAHIRGYLITDSSEFRNDYYLSRQIFEQELAAMAALLESNSSEESQAQLAALQSLYAQWRQIPEELFVLSDQFIENQPALKLFQEQGELSLLQIQSETQTLIDLQAARSPSQTNVRLLKELAAFQTSSALMGASLRAYLITRTPDFRFEYSGKLRAADQHWQDITADLALLSAEQREAVEVIERYRGELSTTVPEMLTLAESDRYREDLFVFNTRAEPLAAELLTLLDEIVVSQQQQLEDELATSRSGLLRAQWQTLIGSFLALGTALGMALLLRRKIADPIVRLTQASAQIMEGNLDSKTPVESQDEIGTLAATFNKMTGYLKASRQELEQYNNTLESQKAELESKNIQISQALDALQSTQTQLIQTEKMSSLGQMVAGIAHEINNPVSFIHGNLPCLQDYTTDLVDLIELYQSAYPETNAEIVRKYEEIDLDFLLEDIPRAFTSMQTGTQRIRDIVLSLRNFSRLDESDMKQTTVTEGIESTLLILQSRLNMQAFRPAIALTKQYGELPSIQCYPGQLNQVFLNVLANAIDAIDSASTTPNRPDWNPQITIETRIATSNNSDEKADTGEADTGQRITIAISDNGEGMASHVQQHMFDPFFTTKPVGSGTGMGLSVSHKIVVDRHQGEIDCVSKVGVGTTVSITLPCHQTTNQEAAVAID